jgi:hypothetical protein
LADEHCLGAVARDLTRALWLASLVDEHYFQEVAC